MYRTGGIRGSALLFASVLLLSSCSSGADDSSGTTSTSSEAASTTSPPPIIVALAPNLGLAPQQCFAEVPLVEEATTTTSTTTLEADDESVATEPTTPETLPQTTTIPRPPTVAVADCSGTNLGRVFAAFCLGDDEDAPGELTAVACSVDAELIYPGDRNIRRAAARVCLQRFEETFGEQYANSGRTAGEFTPTEGVWNLGDHRVVCHATEPVEDVDQ